MLTPKRHMGRRLALMGILILALGWQGTSWATVSFTILTDADMTAPVFAGKQTGSGGDVFWQGGENDLNLLDAPSVTTATIGRNSVGSSSVTLANFSGDIVPSYAVGETVYTGPIVFGLNTISLSNRQAEVLGFTEGLDPEIQSGAGLNTVVFSTDNSYHYSDLRTENSTHDFSATTVAGFFITAGQDPAVVFSNPDVFANSDPRITQRGVIDHFNFVIANIERDDWQMLTVDLLTFTGVEKPGVTTALGDFSGDIVGTTFVSFDTDAVPVVRSLVSAVLPASRSAQIGLPTTYFGVMTNAGTSDLADCSVGPSIGPLGRFDFYTTDPQSNAITGSARAKFDLTAGATQTMLLEVTPSVSISGADIPLRWGCGLNDAATSITGVNSIFIASGEEPAPDIVGLTTVVDLVAVVGQTSLFAVASLNLGESGDITVSLDTGNAPLPVNLSLCRTDPATGACDSAVVAEMTISYPMDESATFAVFAEVTDDIPNNAAAHRIFIRFQDSAGVVRGATSTAIRSE